MAFDFGSANDNQKAAILATEFHMSAPYKRVLITNSESDICQKVTVPRIQKAIKKYEYDEKVVVKQ